MDLKHDYFGFDVGENNIINENNNGIINNNDNNNSALINNYNSYNKQGQGNFCPINLKKNFSSTRPNSVRNKSHSKKITFFFGNENYNNNINNDNISFSHNINNININERSFLDGKNNSAFDINYHNINDISVIKKNKKKSVKNKSKIYYRNSYSNSFLLNNYKKHPKISYVMENNNNNFQNISNINMEKFSPSYNNTYNITGNTFFRKLNYNY